MTAWKRFWEKVEIGDCWLWTASTTQGGYGQFFPKANKRWRAHRWIWTQLVGPIPEGMESDHMCRNPACVNPDHIRIVTKEENLDARPSVRAARTKTHCKHGHEFNAKNTCITARGGRACKPCAARRSRERYWKEKRRESVS